MAEECGQNEVHTGQVERGQEYVLQLQMNRESQKNASNIVNRKWFRVYWLLFLLLCILLIESLFKSGIALGTVIWFMSAEVVSIFFAKYTVGMLNRKAILLAIPIILINIGHLLFYSPSTQIITWLTAFALYAIQLTYLSKPEKSGLFDPRNILDVMHTVFFNMFNFLSHPFRGLIKFSNDRTKRVAIHVLIGILISIPIVGIFTFLFSSADDSFAAIIIFLVRGAATNLGVFIADLLVGTIMCIFASAIFVGANAREHAPQSPAKGSKEISNVTLGTILLMVAVIVVLFVGVQFSHWFGNVPINYIQMDEYSGIARGGFFELVWASCFLLTLIISVTMISAKRNKQLIPVIKIPLLLLCACNLVVLCSAIEKMAVYIGRSGVTSRRVLVLWLIAVIVVCIVVIVIKIIWFPFKAFPFSCVTVITLVCLLSFCDMDYYIATNHIYLAEHHFIQNLEEEMLSRLSYSAVKPITEYKNRIETGTSAYNTTKMQSQAEVLGILNKELSRHKRSVDRIIENNPIMGYNFSMQTALRLLRTN